MTDAATPDPRWTAVQWLRETVGPGPFAPQSIYRAVLGALSLLDEARAAAPVGGVLPSNDNRPTDEDELPTADPQPLDMERLERMRSVQVNERTYPDELAGRSNDEPTDDPWDQRKFRISLMSSDEGRDFEIEREFMTADFHTTPQDFITTCAAISALRARLEAVTTELAQANAAVSAKDAALVANRALGERERAALGKAQDRAEAAEAETLRLRAQLDQIRDACDRAEAEGQDDAIERGVAVHVYSDVSTGALRRIIGADSTPGSVTTTGRCDYRGADGAACDRPNGHADHADAQGHPVPWGIYTEPNRCRWCGGENPLHRTDESGAAVLGGTE